MFYYPQTKIDNIYLNNFKDIQQKYKFKIQEGLYIKKKNSKYPRLSISNKRGKRGAEEVINDLCRGLISDPPFSIIYDIMNDIKINYDYEHRISYSDHTLSFINLSTQEKLLNPKNNLQNIFNIIKQSNFNEFELSEISKYVCSLSCGQKWN